MRRSVGVVLKQRVALAVIAALAVNPSVRMPGGGPPEAAPRPPVARMGTLAVESEPAGAAVYVDGQLTGQTPLQVASLTAGDHRVRLAKGGYLENAQVVSVGAAPSSVRVRLTRDAGSRPELAAQLGGGGGGGGGGGSKLPLYLALAGGGAVAAIVIAKKSGSSTPATTPVTVTSISAAPPTGIVATVTTFTAVGASDPAGRTLTFTWDFGDGTAAGAGASPTHTYAAAGTFTVKVTVTAGSDSASITTSLAVKSLTSSWASTLNCCGTLTGTVVITQSGTNLTGTYADQVASDAGTIAGSVSATTRQVTFIVSLNSSPTTQWSFTGTANAAVNTLTGVGNNVNATGVGPNSPWTMTRP